MAPLGHRLTIRKTGFPKWCPKGAISVPSFLSAVCAPSFAELLCCLMLQLFPQKIVNVCLV